MTGPVVVPLDQEVELQEIVAGNRWLMEALDVVLSAGPPGAYIGAGAIRDTVWDALEGRSNSGSDRDIDVVYFDSTESELAWQAALQRLAPRFRWEVTDQATVHQWQTQALRREVLPYSSIDAAVGAWPETATAVAVRLSRSRKLEIVAPCGLGDLLQGVVRRNPATPDAAAFERRLLTHEWTKRWSIVRIEQS